MAFKQFALDERHTVTIYKRKASRSLRLSITANGEVRVSMPTWTPYSAGLQFARSKLAWIQAQKPPARLLQPGQAIGKAHHLRFYPASVAAARGRVQAAEVVVRHPAGQTFSHPSVQQAAEKAAIQALRRQAETLLPQRLTDLAQRHGFRYGTVTIKHLKSRWGSCDQQGNIVLNLFLMQLPWECIDYVLLHELTHTQIMRHGPDFWQAMERVLPNLKQLRQQMRRHRPVLDSPLAEAVA